MDKNTLIQYLWKSVISQDTNIIYDPEFNIGDEDLEEILNACLLKVEPNSTLDNVSSGSQYLLIILAKKEIFTRLATKSAPLYSIKTKDSAVNKQERFDHYFQLIQQLDKEYKEELATGRNSTIETGEVFIDGRYFTKRNYDHSSVPKGELTLDNAYIDKLEVSWTSFDNTKGKFGCYRLYICEQPIIDKYSLADDYYYTRYSINSSMRYTLNEIAKAYSTVYEATTPVIVTTNVPGDALEFTSDNEVEHNSECEASDIEMALNQLRKIQEVTPELLEILDMYQDLDGWALIKLAKAADYVSGVLDYYKYKCDHGDATHDDEHTMMFSTGYEDT